MAQQVTIIGKMTRADGTTESVQIDGIAALQVDPGYGIPAPPPTVAPPIYYPPVFPAHPIVKPPVGIWPPPGTVTPPIYYPPEVWPPLPPDGMPPRPAHPIVLPDPPEIPPIPPNPPIDPPGGGLGEGWQWYYTDRWGFVLVWVPPGGGGKPQPPGGNLPHVEPVKK